MENTDNRIRRRVRMNRGIVSCRPDLHDVRDARGLAVILAKRNTKIGLGQIRLILTEFIRLVLQLLMTPESRRHDATLNGLGEIRKTLVI